MGKPIVVLDFDGVVHSYISGWKGADMIHDPPVEGSFDFIRKALDEGFSINIHSSRSHQDNAIPAMKSWFIRNGGADIVNKIYFPTYKPPATITIDDRGFLFEGVFPDIEFIKNFKPWYKK